MTLNHEKDAKSDFLAMLNIENIGGGPFLHGSICFYWLIHSNQFQCVLKQSRPTTKLSVREIRFVELGSDLCDTVKMFDFWGSVFSCYSYIYSAQVFQFNQ